MMKTIECSVANWIGHSFVLLGLSVIGWVAGRGLAISESECRSSTQVNESTGNMSCAEIDCNPSGTCSAQTTPNDEDPAFSYCTCSTAAESFPSLSTSSCFAFKRSTGGSVSVECSSGLTECGVFRECKKVNGSGGHGWKKCSCN